MFEVNRGFNRAMGSVEIIFKYLGGDENVFSFCNFITSVEMQINITKSYHFASNNEIKSMIVYIGQRDFTMPHLCISNSLL